MSREDSVLPAGGPRHHAWGSLRARHREPVSQNVEAEAGAECALSRPPHGLRRKQACPLPDPDFWPPALGAPCLWPRAVPGDDELVCTPIWQLGGRRRCEGPLKDGKTPPGVGTAKS